MLNWRQTILSQFQSSPKLTALLDAISQWLGPEENYENFYTMVWNIDQAAANDSTYGLDVWGRIVNIPRTVTLNGVPTFGFQEAGDRTGFNQGPFWEASIGVSQNFVLTNAVYYQLILAKAAFNITNGSTQAINAIMMNLFAGRGNCYVTDGRNVLTSTFGFQEAGDRTGFNQGPFGDMIYGTLPNNMTLTYTFEFFLEPFEMAIAQSGVLPKPVGCTPFWAFLGN